MSDLIVVGFTGEDTADQVLNKLQALQQEHLVDLEDACVVVRDHSGNIRLKQAMKLVGVGAASGGLSGALGRPGARTMASAPEPSPRLPCAAGRPGGQVSGQ